MSDIEKQVPISGLIGPKDIAFRLIEKRNRASSRIVQAQIAASDFSAGSFCFFVDASNDSVGIFLFEYDNHFALELFAELCPQILVKIVGHFVNEDLVNRPHVGNGRGLAKGDYTNRESGEYGSHSGHPFGLTLVPYYSTFLYRSFATFCDRTSKEKDYAKF
jgi:hypothetical protein